MNDDWRIRFLIVDDEPALRGLCTRIGESLGFLCLEAASADAVLAVLENDAPDIVVTDLRLPEQSGLELLERIKTLQPRTEVAIMTGHGSISSAVQAMKLGAYHYITKPFAVEEMKLMLERMAEKVRLMAERDRLRERVRELETSMDHVGAVARHDSSYIGGGPVGSPRAHSSAGSEPLVPQPPTDLEHLERLTIQRVFEQVRGDKALAGKMLGISRATLYRKLKRYNMVAQSDLTHTD
jgi:DNA-binding NtrC family response regulator